MIVRPSIVRYASGDSRGLPDLAPVVCSSSSVPPSKGPPTLPPLARNSSTMAALKSFSSDVSVMLLSPRHAVFRSSPVDPFRGTRPQMRCQPSFSGLASGLASIPGLLALLRGDRRGRVGQRVDAAAGLRERDDLADRVLAGQQRGDAIPAERDTAVRRRAEGEGVQQESELLLGLVVIDAHHREHPLLDVATVDTDRAAADLVAVAHDVVGVGQRAARIGVERRLRLRRG